MNTQRDPDAIVAAWLDDGPDGLPPDTRQAISVGVRAVTQRKGGIGWRSLRTPSFDLRQLPVMVGSTAVIVLAVALALGFLGNRNGGIGGRATPTPSVAPTATPSAEPTATPVATPTETPAPTTPSSPFYGTWISTSDGDGGTQTMTVEAADGGVTVVVTDDIASVCSGTPSTMTGEGRISGSELVIPTPDYKCDDGTEPHLLNGDPTPLNEVLRNLTYVYDPERDTLSAGDARWFREGASSPFYGTWISTSDRDGGTQTMTVEAADGGVTIVVTDDIASVCSGTPSTMTGEGRITGGELVIPTPDYKCDDGSKPQLVNGDPTPLNEVLRNLTYVYDPETDTLSVGDARWIRDVAPHSASVLPSAGEPQ